MMKDSDRLTVISTVRLTLITVENIHYTFRKVIKCIQLHYFNKVIEIFTLLITLKQGYIYI